MEAPPKDSAGLTFMLAAQAAMPRTLGDRERIAAMDEAMRLAVKNRFAFDKLDVLSLDRMRIRTCVGIFRPLDEHYYLLACLSGGTYARMWEAHTERKPWMATTAVFRPHLAGESKHTIIGNNRIAVQAGALLPGSDDPDLATHDGLQLWWCTSMSNDEITLCRYRVEEETRKYHGRIAAPFVAAGGKPVRIRKLTRAQWTEWNKQAKDLLDAAIAAKAA